MATVQSIDEFTRAFIECALWAEIDENKTPLDANYTIDDIAPESLQKIIADCQRFQAENAADLATYNHSQWSADELGGHDYWLTRNGHGAGFWDRDCLPDDVRERLTTAAHNAKEVNLYVGDDGQLYIYP
jgi:hypothetical protein